MRLTLSEVLFATILVLFNIIMGIIAPLIYVVLMMSIFGFLAPPTLKETLYGISIVTIYLIILLGLSYLLIRKIRLYKPIPILIISLSIVTITGCITGVTGILQLLDT